MGGKRGLALKLSFLLHVIGLLALIAGCVTPFWSRVVDDSSGDVTAHQGLFVSCTPGGPWTFRSFNEFRQAGSNKTTLLLTLSASLALAAIFLQLFLAESYGFALYNASCGRKYNPEWLMIFSILSGTVGVVVLVLYEQYTGRSVSDSAADVKSLIDYSRGTVIIFIAASFLAAFFTVCDRTGNRSRGK